MKSRNRIILLIAVVAASVGIVAIVARMQPERMVTQSTDPDSGQPVSVHAVRPAAHTAVITALGEVRSLHRLNLTAMVDGRIEYVNPALRNGAIVLAGEVLVRIEQSRYVAELATARSLLAQAELALLTAQREAEDAARGWERSGRALENASEFVLRQPQLRVAEAERAAAVAQVALAERMLSDTVVTMPFDGVVLTAGPAPQTTLVAGTPIAQVASVEAAEIAITLDDAQWQLLPADIDGRTVRIVDATDPAAVSWAGTVVRVAGHIDEQSRQRVVWVQVDRPLSLDPPLLPGTFVSVEVLGRDLTNTLRIPESALTNTGLVWFVTADQRLYSVRTTALFYTGGFAVVPPPQDLPENGENEGVFAVAVAPNNSFVNGMSVSPITTGAGGLQ